MAVLLVAEHNNHALSGATAKALTAAKALGSPVHILVAGSNAEGVAQQAAALGGVEKVLLADASHLKAQLAEDMAALDCSADGRLRCARRRCIDHGQEFRATRCSASGCCATFGCDGGSEPDAVRAPDLCRQCHPDR